MPPTSRQHVNVLVVGSGPTGATYARVIADTIPAASIMIVDGGPIVTAPPGNHVASIPDPSARRNAQIASQGPTRFGYSTTEADYQNSARSPHDRSLLRRPGLFLVETGPRAEVCFPAASAASNVGGMGAHWFGASPRPSVRERADFVDDDVLDSALSTAESLLRVTKREEDHSPIAEHLSSALNPVLSSDSTVSTVRPMPMALVELDDPGFAEGRRLRRSAPDLMWEPLAGSTNFELRPRTLCQRILMAGGRAVGVELYDLTRHRLFTVTADFVVIAADGLRTPQLLFASGIRPRALGRYFNEHVQFAVSTELTHLDLGAATSDPWARHGASWIPSAGPAFPFHGQVEHVHPSSFSGADTTGRHPIASIVLFVPKDVTENDRLTFSESSTDWCGLPSIDIHYEATDRDRRLLDQAIEAITELSRAAGKPVADTRPQPLPNGTSLHYQGAVRMGAKDDGTSVCDRNSQVWDTDNVFVAGNGVIPVAAACNSTLTAVAYAVLGAREIARRLKK